LAAARRKGPSSAEHGECSWHRWHRRSADELAAREDLNDDHRAAAVRTHEGWPPIERVLGLLSLVLWHMQQLTCEREADAAAAVGQQTVVADAVEAAGQHVQ
jgi:hypothetical protein